LFYWKYHFNKKGCGCVRFGNIKFQSLFYWKYHFNITGSIDLASKKASFNPCFTGSTTSTDAYDEVVWLSTIVSILVLLEVPLQPGALFFLL